MFYDHHSDKGYDYHFDKDQVNKKGARLLLSGTLLRKLMEGKPVPQEFAKPEVIAVLNDYYNTLEQKVEIKLHGAATGEVRKQ